MADHTPEPWVGRIKHKTQRTISAPPRGDIAAFPGDDPIADANMRRTLACVNACAGIPTEQLEQQAVNIAIHFGDDIATTTERDAARAEADRLRAALERFLRFECVCGHAKEGPRESHYYGDRTMSTPCQHCDCKRYERDVKAEFAATKQARAALGQEVRA